MNRVEIVADSKNEFGQRITSMVVTFPRFLLAEMNTHRALSRNSASSRAIRFEKMVESVMTNPFIPMAFQKDHAGMQGTEYLSDKDPDGFHTGDVSAAITEWLMARDLAVQQATNLSEIGVTKQLCNRLLEPFMMHQALITSTEWENFFSLRVSEFAEIHFQDIAQKMLDAMNASEPKQLKAGEWHIPFGDKFNISELYNYQTGKPEGSEWTGQDGGPEYRARKVQDLMVKLATVRCARISYLNQGKETPIAADLELHDRLASSGHWSAFEHCARAMSDAEYFQDDRGIGKSDKDTGWCGNFRAFIQYRKMFKDENRQDSRLIKK